MLFLQKFFRNVIAGLKKPAAFAGLALLCLPSVRATDDLYQNIQDSSYTIPGNPPPIIDATNFENDHLFSVSYSTYQTMTALPYEFKNVVNYTNGENGTMTFNSPLSTNGFIFLNTYGLVAKFNTWRPALNNSFPAGTFFNQGTIRVDSLLDGNNIFSFGNFQFYILTSRGQCLITATNIINPGNIIVGAEGQIQMTGQNVDLSRGIFAVESTLNANQGVIGSALLNNVNFASSGVVGLDTNADWNPGIDLGSNFALSSFFALPPYYLYLTNSTAYFDVNGLGTSNVVYRSVFVENDNPAVPYNVYIDAPNAINLGFEGGAAHVEWQGAVIDPATGGTTTNYLYLTDNYRRGASTNVAVIGGVPDNFSFVSSTTPLLVGPTPAGFSNVFSTLNISNRYAYMNGQIQASSVSTNVSDTNPHGSLTNLPGRILINASQELNLENAFIGGQDYLALTATNQFDGSGGARISSPYSDFNLGVTNGQMVISNLISGSLPNWSGSIQAWSTRWVEVDATTGVTNDFRVLLVGSRLQPTATPWVQNFKLHGATNLVISDALNVYASMSIDAQSLTLSTNGVGNGATSVDGELNWLGTTTLGPLQFPNLLRLTNNGAIRAPNLAQFIGRSNSASFGPGLPAVKATGKLSELIGANVKKGNLVIIGSKQYVFVNTLTNKLANQVKIGLNFDASMNNLIAAINGAAGAGTKYSKVTTSNAIVHASALVGHAFTVTAATAGVVGNSILTWTTSTNLTWNSHNFLYGGTDAMAATTNYTALTVPLDAFINSGLVADQGTTLSANNFLNTGVISNGVGSFSAKTLTTTLTNGAIFAGGNISLTADTLLISNQWLQCLSLTLSPTNLIDAGLTNGNFWTVGRYDGTGGQGFALTTKPPTGDLLGTTITNICPGPNKAILNTWAGTNRGVSVLGFSNNMALGHLVLNMSPTGAVSRINFTGVGVSNALYVDLIEFTGFLTNGIYSSFEFTNWLNINTNLVIYYGDARINDVTVAEAIDKASLFSGKNHGRLRWVPAYTGYYSSVPFVSGGVTNLVNAGLAQSADMDSNGDGTYNASDPNAFFTPDQVNLSISFTNVPPLLPMLTWNSIPGATNYIYYNTNSPSGPWLLLTNYISPVPYLAYPSAPKPLSLVDYGAAGGPPRFYGVRVDAWLTYPF